MYHPPRGGVRGGRDQFNWEDVKTDKYRENYLGHSLFAPVGRWQQGKDLSWYSKDHGHDEARQEEIRSIKEAEADVMAEFLGAGKRKVVKSNVTQQELNNVLKKEQEEDADDDENIVKVTKEATKGLGFRSSGRLLIGEETHTGNGTGPLQDQFGDGVIQSSSDVAQGSNYLPSNIQTPDATSISKSSTKKHKKKEKKEKKHKKEKHHKTEKREHKSSSSHRKRQKIE